MHLHFRPAASASAIAERGCLSTAHPVTSVRARTTGVIISIRHVLATAALVSAALALTACGPEDDSSSGADSTASAGAEGAAKDAKGGKDDQGKGNCPTLAKGHKVIWVNNVEGAMNHVLAKDATPHCDPKSQAGAAYEATGEVKTYSVASGTAKVTVISKKDGKRHALTAQKGGIAHVKTCADPKGEHYDGGQSETNAEDCWGQNFYDVAVGSGNKITEMTELYSS
ncbi:hypothetical protein [Streptomyces sp. NPDC048636]|uniref:hypothetical protein n=1 Tax=Streptomyces sp. NPDC048636 TaxID=3155762 RepID=UPI00343A6CBD